jgi:RNA methyltransferase, TrmH family
MPSRLITSAQNPVARRFRDARSGKDPSLVFMEGRHIVAEALRARWPLEVVLLREDLWERWHARFKDLVPADRVHAADKNLMERLSASASPEGILALGPKIEAPWPSPSPGSVYLFLDAVQDPANVGILVRSAKALGAAGVWAGSGSADPFKAAALSRSAGATFHLPIRTESTERFLAWAKAARVALVGADAEGVPIPRLPRTERPIVLAVGNEGQGLSPQLREACTALISIPMSPEWDSLNAAVAGSLLLYTLSPLSRTQGRR